MCGPRKRLRSIIVFLLGAGFNADAARLVRESVNTGLDSDCYYPLVSDTLRLSFGLDHLPPGTSVEDLFAEKLASGDFTPMKNLAEALMKSDYYIADPLSRSSTKTCYHEFFDSFVDGQFLTFNYDSFVEAFLFQRSRWWPEDGLGVEIDVSRGWNNQSAAGRTTSEVLHLHGSLCVYTDEYERREGWLTPRESPQFFFDPTSIASLFQGYTHNTKRGFRRPEERVVAPVPDKAPELAAPFIQAVYHRAKNVLEDDGRLVSIGYSFSEHDRKSWDPLLKALRSGYQPSLTLVSPDAEEVARRLYAAYPELKIQPIAGTFRNWVHSGFPSSPTEPKSNKPPNTPPPPPPA